MPNGVTRHLGVAATNVTVRNNIFDNTNAKYGYAMEVAPLGQEPPPTNTHILNNVFLRSDVGVAGAEFVPLSVDSACTGTLVRNNLVHAPLYDKYASWDTANTTQSNNLVNLPHRPAQCDDARGNATCVDPKLARTDPSDANYCKLTDGSPAVDRGYAVDSVTDDFYGNARPRGAGWDIGVEEHQ